MHGFNDCNKTGKPLAVKMGLRLEAEFNGFTLHISLSPEHLVRNSELAVAATTSHTPLFKSFCGSIKRQNIHFHKD